MTIGILTEKPATVQHTLEAGTVATYSLESQVLEHWQGPRAVMQLFCICTNFIVSYYIGCILR